MPDRREARSAAQDHDCNSHMVELDDGYGWDCSICWNRKREAPDNYPVDYDHNSQENINAHFA